jgi:hypothetical protein
LWPPLRPGQGPGLPPNPRLANPTNKNEEFTAKGAKKTQSSQSLGFLSLRSPRKPWRPLRFFFNSSSVRSVSSVVFLQFPLCAPCVLCGFSSIPPLWFFLKKSMLYARARIVSPSRLTGTGFLVYYDTKTFNTEALPASYIKRAIMTDTAVENSVFIRSRL